MAGTESLTCRKIRRVTTVVNGFGPNDFWTTWPKKSLDWVRCVAKQEIALNYGVIKGVHAYMISGVRG